MGGGEILPPSYKRVDKNMKNPDKNSKSKIKEAREERGWTQEYLASIVGCSRGHLNLIENNERNLTLKLAKKVAYALSLKIEDL